MNEKIIYIKPDEEITSVIDKLVRTKSREIFLVIPMSAVITQSLVNLKLLKREADNLRKQVMVVSQDGSAIRLAKKADFETSDSLDELAAAQAQEVGDEDKEEKEQEEGEETEEKDDGEDVLREQVSDNEFATLLREERRRKPLRMSDIVSGSPQARPAERKKGIFEKTAGLIFDRGAKNKARAAALLPKRDQEQEEDSYEEYKHGQRPRIRDKEYFNENEDRSGRRKILGPIPLKIFGIFVGAAIIIAALVFLLMLPKAEIIIEAKRETAVINLKITADKNLSEADLASNKIPAQMVKLEERESMEFVTTGQRQLNDKAKGIITVFNAYSSSPQALVETTRFLSPQGKIYRLTETVTIPGAKIEEGKILASSIDVEVQADQAGEEYNIGPNDFTIPGFKGSPKYTGFYGKSKKDISGGSTENARVLTQEDFDKAKSAVWEKLQAKAEGELAAQIPSGYKLLDGVIQTQMGEVKSSSEVGGKAEKFTLSINATARAVIFSESDVWQVIQKGLADNMGDVKEIKEKSALEYKEMKADFGKGQLAMEVKGVQELVWKVDTEEIKNITAGKKKEEVQEVFLGRPEIKQASFSLWPFWSNKIPKQTEKIEVTVDPVTSSAND